MNPVTGGGPRSPWSKRPATQSGTKAPGLISKREAVEFVTDALSPDTDRREAKNRISHRVHYAIAQGHLKLHSGEWLAVRELVQWCSEKPDWAKTFVKLLPAIEAEFDQVLPAFGTQGVLHALPQTVEESNAELAKALGKIYTLEREAAAHCAELDLLRPIGERQEVTRQKSAAAGRRGGRGNVR